jgi:plasmid maintenance system killer protein
MISNKTSRTGKHSCQTTEVKEEVLGRPGRYRVVHPEPVAVQKERYVVCLNQQFRICFIWENGHASSVEIVDYHK